MAQIYLQAQTSQAMVKNILDISTDYLYYTQVDTASQTIAIR
jgi:hypothetical protein